MVVSERWFKFCPEIKFPYPLLTSIQPPFHLSFTSFYLVLPLFNLNLTSASSGIFNNSLETTVYRPLDKEFHQKRPHPTPPPQEPLTPPPHSLCLGPLFPSKHRKIPNIKKRGSLRFFMVEFFMCFIFPAIPTWDSNMVSVPQLGDLCLWGITYKHSVPTKVGFPWVHSFYGTDHISLREMPL